MAKLKPKPEDWLVGDNYILLCGWARDGLTNEQIYTSMGVPKSTFYDWCDRNSEFSAAIKRNRFVVDFEIENALFQAAKEGNTTAQIFWLKNRKQDRWKDRVEQATDQTAINKLDEILASVKENADGDKSNE